LIEIAVTASAVKGKLCIGAGMAAMARLSLCHGGSNRSGNKREKWERKQGQAS
jgi:hypothetical protein